jgi:transcriptional regulator with XRE-family HTH domain
MEVPSFVKMDFPSSRKMSDFGLILREILKSKNLSQRAAADALGMDQSTVSYYCTKKNPPRAHVVEHMARKLGVSVWALMDEPPIEMSIREVNYRRRMKRLQAEAVQESGPSYAAPLDRRGIWMDRLRAEYQKDTDRVATFVRAAWPKAMAEEIIAWLAAKK